MVIKEATHKMCSECGQHVKQETPPVYGCDKCDKEITGEKLTVHVFFTRDMVDANGNWDDNRDYHFCCWSCVFAFVQNMPFIEHVRFFDLPYVIVEKPDGEVPIQNYSDFCYGLKS